MTKELFSNLSFCLPPQFLKGGSWCRWPNCRLWWKKKRRKDYVVVLKIYSNDLVGALAMKVSLKKGGGGFSEDCI